MRGVFFTAASFVLGVGFALGAVMPARATTISATSTIKALISGSGTCSIGSIGNPAIASTPEALSSLSLITDATLTVTCTDGDTPYRIYATMSGNANDTVQRRLKSSSAAQYINYDIFTDAARTTLWPTTFLTGLSGAGASTTFHTYPRVPSQSGATAGTWVDTISFVVTY